MEPALEPETGTSARFTIDQSYRAVFEAVPAPCMLLDADLCILDANGAYLRSVDRRLGDLVGRYLFDAFPPNPEDPTSSQPLTDSVRQVLGSGTWHRMPVMQYDMEEPPGSGHYVTHWWSLVNVPVRHADGTVVGVLSTVEDVTEVVGVRQAGELDRATAAGLQARTAELEADLFARSHELARVVAAEAQASRRLQGLAEAALELNGAETVDDLADLVVRRGLGALGAEEGAVAVRDDDQELLRIALTAGWAAAAGQDHMDYPLDGPLPLAVAARTGRTVVLPDREAGLAFAPQMAQVYAGTGKTAWVALPLQVGDRLLGALAASWTDPRPFTAAELELIGAFAAQCAQALDRMQRRDAERQAATATRRMAETLQRSLLTDPPQPDHLQLVVRYLPAAAEAEVGGDWYDAFVVQGRTSLVIGDVAGHDRDAAATMAQLRNLLRGVSHVLGKPPAVVLAALDAAMADLTPGTLATCLLAQLEQDDDLAERGQRRLRWSSAGHCPPLLIQADGTVELLDRQPDLLLGVDPSTVRQDNTALLPPGATVLLYTDGLVERRDAGLDVGLTWLRQRAAAWPRGLDLTELCDQLLADLPADLDDDVALLAVRAHPEDRPRPASSSTDSSSTGSSSTGSSSRLER